MDKIVNDEALKEFKHEYDKKILNNSSDIFDSINVNEPMMFGPSGLMDCLGGLTFEVNEEGMVGYRVGLDGELVLFGGKYLVEQVLWINSDTVLENFSEQTVTVDLTKFNYVGIEYLPFYKSSGTKTKIAIFPVHSYAYWTAIAYAPDGFSKDPLSYGKNSRILPIRPIVINNSNIKFFNTWSIGTDGNEEWTEGYSDSGNACIPVRIFGLR